MILIMFQYTALLSSIWGMEDQGLRRKDRMVKYPDSPRQPPVQMYNYQHLHVNRRGRPARRRRLFKPLLLKRGKVISDHQSNIHICCSGHRRQPLSPARYKYQSYWAPPSLPQPQPTPYQVRMGSTLSPANTRISHISG